MAKREEPVLVTTAAPSRAAERDARERRYLITMAVRVVMFIVAIPLALHHWWFVAAIAIALSLILPWIAVNDANTPKRTREAQAPSLYRGEDRRELEGPSDSGH
ncbi:MAG TPA: DUF3099 domain-containing protein [Mycobacteriales bacterium]|nr:DUF3099 domain-containing protein [Mycobacteriales bacterium]